MGLRNLPQLLLRVGLAFTFLYAAWSSFQNPINWIGFFPQSILALFSAAFSPQQVLTGFSLLEAAIGILLLLGSKLVLVSLVAVFFLAGIIWFNLGAMDIIFRDVGLLFAALALFALARKGR